MLNIPSGFFFFF